jgi:hypothetical protein
VRNLLATEVRRVIPSEFRLRNLLNSVHSKVADAVYSPSPGSEVVSQFLALAPTDACVELADAWTWAQKYGMPEESFTPEERFLLELVEAVYSTQQTAPGTAAVFDRLLTETNIAEAA